MRFRVLPLLLFVAGTGFNVNGQQPSTPPAQTVIVFGDSITAGNMLPKDQRSQVWLALVEQRSQGKLRLVNEGKGGRPTDSEKEFKEMLHRHPKADILVLALGMNDSRDIHDDCVPKAVKHLQAMIDMAQAAYGKIPILLVGPSNIRKDALGPSANIADQRVAKLKELNAAYIDLAQKDGCRFVSLYGTIPEASLTKDGVHPDAPGNEAIAQVILPKLLSSAP